VLATCFLAVVTFRRGRGWALVALIPVACVVVYAVAFAIFVLLAYIPPAGPMLLSVVLAPTLVYASDVVTVERSLTRQLRSLRSWLTPRDKEIGEENRDISWRLAVLQDLQEKLGSLYELHQALLESTHDLVAIFDQSGKPLLSNEAFRQALGGGASLTLD